MFFPLCQCNHVQGKPDFAKRGPNSFDKKVDQENWRLQLQQPRYQKDYAVLSFYKKNNARVKLISVLRRKKTEFSAVASNHIKLLKKSFIFCTASSTGMKLYLKTQKTCAVLHFYRYSFYISADAHSTSRVSHISTDFSRQP